MAASWKNIRDSIAGAAPKQAPSKEEFREPEPATGDHHVPPASPVEDAPTPFRASDPTAIANIVDSVLAELRPQNRGGDRPEARRAQEGLALPLQA